MPGKTTKKDRRYLEEFAANHTPRVETIGGNNVSWQRALTNRIAGAVEAGIQDRNPAYIYPAAALAAGAIMNPAQLFNSLLGGEVVDKISKKLTGNSFGDAVSKALDINPQVASVLNPGYLFGGFRGKIKGSRLGSKPNNSIKTYLPEVIPEADFEVVRPQVSGNTQRTLSLPTQQQSIRQQLKNINAWSKRFGYKPIPLEYSKNPQKAQQAVRDLVLQHNTFIRGVSIPPKEDKMRYTPFINRFVKPIVETYDGNYYDIDGEILGNVKYGYDPDEVKKYMLTHYAGDTGAGRVGVNYDDNTIYTSNMLEVGKGYSRYDYNMRHNTPENIGVGFVRRPNLIFNPNSSLIEWVADNDFNFANNDSYYTRMLLDNEILKSGKLPSRLKELSKDINYNSIQTIDDYITNHTIYNKNELKNSIIKGLNNHDNEIYNYVPHYSEDYLKSKSIKELEALRETYRYIADLLFQRHNTDLPFGVDENVEDKLGKFNFHRAYTKNLTDLENAYADYKNKKIKSLHKEAQDTAKKKYFEEMKGILGENISNIYPENDSYRHSMRDGRQHFIFVGNEGEQGLDFIRYATPEELQSIQESVSHFPGNTKPYPGTSRRVRELGGTLGEPIKPTKPKKVDLSRINLKAMYDNNRTYGGDRYIDTTMLRTIDNYLINNNVHLPQRQAIAYTVQQEGNTTKDHGNGAAGLTGWRGNRAVGLPKTLQGQMNKLYTELYGPFNGDNWNHGGKGSGYNSAREAQEAFKNAITLEDALRALNYGYVRPPREDILYRIQNGSKAFTKTKRLGGYTFRPQLWQMVERDKRRSGGPIGRFIKVPDDIAGRVSNLYNYAKTYLKTKLSGTGDGTFIDLSNQNVSRIKANTKGVKSILANEFVEHNNNTVRKKKDFINTTDTLLGDRQIPLSKISTFYGVEDGKLKAGPLEIFNDTTTVVPNRAKNVGKIKEYYSGKRSSPQYQKAIEKGIEKYNKSKGYEPDIVSKILPFIPGATPGSVLYRNLISEEGNSKEGRRRARARRAEILDSIRTEYSYLDNSVLPFVITENNDTIRNYKLNATPKTLFADENGNAVFVSNPRYHTKELNSYLQEHPMYPIMVDNGRYAAYQTHLPNASIYSGLNSPDNMFIVGTTNKRSNGGRIHIKPENRGKFNATKARTGKTTEELTHSKNPITRKRAIFAQNAAKWNKK